MAEEQLGAGAMETEKKEKEDYVIVLDFLQHGYPFDRRPSHKKTPIVQAIGKERFILLELVPKEGIFLQPYEEVYIGSEKRDKIHHIAGRLSIDRLTTTANAELQPIIEDIVSKNETKFVEFFNKAAPLTTRMHQLELLPGLGKKHMWEIVGARETKPFESFEDIKNRVKLMPDPKKIIVQRIILELKGEEKYKLFTEK